MAPTQASDGEDEERPPDPEVLESRLKHCNSVKEHAVSDGTLSILSTFYDR